MSEVHQRGWASDRDDDGDPEVDPSLLTAFGIEVHSRYGRAWELVELLNFAAEARRRGVAHLVRRAFYDSKSCGCWFELADGVTADHPAAPWLWAAAYAALSVFVLFGDEVRNGGRPGTPAFERDSLPDGPDPEAGREPHPEAWPGP